MKTTAQFTDTNGRDAGQRVIRIHLSRNGMPFCVVFGGASYYCTGKHGESFGNHPTSAPAGTPMSEMRLRGPGDERLWVDAAGAFVHLD